MVLVVDDEPMVGSIFARILRDHDVTVVTTGQEALALLDAGKHFDAVVSDLIMPEMSGMAFYEQLAQRHPDVARRVAFVTGGVFSADVSAFLDRVPNPRVAKPLKPESVRALVRRLLGEE